MILDNININFNNKIKVYAFVGPSGTGKSYRAQMVAGEYNIHYIIDDGLFIKDNEVIAGNSAKKAPTKIETVKHALFLTEQEKIEIKKAIKKYKPESILILGTSDNMVDKIAENLGLPKIEKKIYIEEIATREEMETAKRFGILDKMEKLEKDLLSVENASNFIDFDLNGFYDDMKQVIVIIGYNIPVGTENYFEVRRRFVVDVLEVAKENGLSRTEDRIEECSGCFYIVFKHDDTWRK